MENVLEVGVGLLQELRPGLMAWTRVLGEGQRLTGPCPDLWNLNQGQRADCVASFRKPS